MWPYILLIFLPIVIPAIERQGSILYISKQNSYKNDVAMGVFWGVLLLLLMLRHECVGIDVRTYERIYQSLSHGTWEQVFARSNEVAYSVLNKFVAICVDDFRGVLIVSALLSVVFVAKAYIKYSTDTALSISLFIVTSNFVLMFSGLRQAIAISIGFVAFEYVKAKKPIVFLLTVIIAMLFHMSAFMLLVLYPLYYIRLTRKQLFGVVPLLGIVFVFNQQIFGYLGVILSMFSEYDAEISETGSYTMLVLFLILLVFSYVIPDESKMDDDTIGMRNYLLMAVALQMFAPLHPLAMRMNYYYIVFIPLVIPRIIACRSVKWNQIAIAARYIMIVTFIAYFFLTAPSSNVLGTFPYCFFWADV